MDLREKIKELEGWIENISAIQNQLLEKLGYEIKYKNPYESNIYISKINNKSTKHIEPEKNI